MERAFLFFILLISYTYASVSDDFLKSVKKYSGVEVTFIQISKIEGFEEENVYEGKAVISENGKIKIVYLKPEIQEILIDGSVSWLYIPSENQLIVSKIDEDIALVRVLEIISGKIDLEKFFKKKKKDSLIILYPKESFLKDIKKIEIKFKKDKPDEITVFDKEGNLVIVRIKKFKYLDKVPELHINYPKNVEIIKY